MADAERIREVFFGVTQRLVGSELFGSAQSFSGLSEHVFLSPVHWPNTRLHLQGHNTQQRNGVVLATAETNKVDLERAILTDQILKHPLLDHFDCDRLPHGFVAYILLSNDDFDIEHVLKQLESHHPPLLEQHSSWMSQYRT